MRNGFLRIASLKAFFHNLQGRAWPVTGVSESARPPLICRRFKRLSDIIEEKRAALIEQ